jgi:hypothetical protein
MITRDCCCVELGFEEEECSVLSLVVASRAADLTA